MQIAGKVVVVTGAASGIGKALCQAFAREGARRVVAVDLNLDGASAVAAEISGKALAADVGREKDIQEVVSTVLAEEGRIDVFFSNAGVATAGDVNTLDAEWQRTIDVNFMAHLWASRAVLPSMLERGDGYLCSTASAAGLLTQIGSAPYAVTKHMAVAFAEWLSVTYGERGIKVSCLCPQGVKTGMLNESSGPSFLLAGAIEPDAVASCTLEAIRDERFLILPHPEVQKFMEQRVADRDRWLSGMRRLAKRISEAG
jgi:NAD(P)-dependent dehydrogenase (short-subunit alcohol dehydrogenase family)